MRSDCLIATLILFITQMKPKFFNSLIYVLAGICTFGILSALGELMGIRIFGEPMYSNSSEAIIDALLTIWWLIAISMLLRQQKKGLTLFNASFGANVLATLRSQSSDLWSITFTLIVTLGIYWYFNRSTVKNYLVN